MTDQPFQRLRQFLAELKRRQVYRVSAAYAGAAFVLWQATALLVRALDWPEWVLTVVVLAAIGGFPLVVAVAWMYEVSPGGFRRTPEREAGRDEAEAGGGVSRRGRVAGGLAALVLAGGLVWWLWPHQTLAFGEGDTLLLADFRNRTADSTLTGSLTSAFRISLEQSPYLNVYSESKVHDALERMRVDPDSTRLTGELAREVAAREGVPVAVVPAVSSVAGTYRLGFSIYPAGEADPVATADVEAESRDGVLDAVDRLAVRLRERLGESRDEIDRHHEPLEEVTTPSLTALKLFSRGQERYTDGEWSAARRLFRHALDVDSSFTGARAQLGLLVYEHFDREKGEELLRRAVSNAGDLTEFESFMIRGFYAEAIERDPGKAADLYRSLVDLYPHRSAPHNNLARMLRRSGQLEDAVEHYRRALSIDPSTHLYYAGLNNTYLYEMGRVDSALALARRRTARDSAYFWAWDHLGWALVGADSLDAARRAFQRAVELRPHASTQRLRLGHVALRRGRPEEAAGHYRGLLELDSIGFFERYHARYFLGLALRRMGEDSAAAARFRAYRDQVNRTIEANPERPYFRMNLGRVQARLGAEEGAWRTARDALARDSTSANLHFGAALVAGALGRREPSLRHLKAAFRRGYRNYVFAKLHPDLEPLWGWPPFRETVDSLLHLAGEGGPTGRETGAGG